MQSAALPDNEEQRLEALLKYRILDTIPEQDYDDLTLLASQICGTPIALVSLVDDHRQWFKSRVGLDAPETPKDVAFCAHAILGDEIFEIKDSFADERFQDNPLATDAPNVRFYAGAPLITPEGYKIGTLCVIDNKPRELTDAQRKNLMALSRQVISQMELRLAIERANEAVKTKSIFLANMSHEIRTPMNAVISCTRLLKDEISDERFKKLLGIIDSAGQSLITLINDILDFSKLESGKISMEVKPFNIHDTTAELVTLLGSRAVEKNISLSLGISDGVPEWAEGDITRYRQIVMNLIGNAIKFGKTKVDVSLATEVVDKKTYVSLSVIDDGIGIAPEDQDKIFQDFVQIDASITRKYGGTGLGLSICKKLALAMNGEIDFVSKQNKGSTFKVNLLMPETSPVEIDEEEAQSRKFAGTSFNLNILLAEDDEINQIVFQEIMQKFGYSVDIVSDGAQCLEAVQKKNYDLIFMDMQMPVMDGIGATKAIRSLDLRQPTIVALTANAFEEDRKACEVAGMDGFVTKPVDETALLETISQVGLKK